MSTSERVKRMADAIRARSGGRISDAAEGSALGAFLAAIADELELADFEHAEAVASLLIQAAEGAELDQVLNGFRFLRRPAIPSIVLLKFSVNAPGGAPENIPIPKGAVVSTDPDEIAYQSDTTTVEVLEFITYESGKKIPYGQQYIECYAECTQGGLITNVGEYKVNTVVSSLPGVDAVTNEYAAAGGVDAWTDDEYRAAWFKALKLLGRCTPDAILAAVPLISDVIGEKITFAHLSECDPEPGKSKLYLATADGGLEAGPRDKAQAFCDRYLRGAGTTLTVCAPQEKPINLNCTVKYGAGFVNKPLVNETLKRILIQYVQAINIGGERVGLAGATGYVFVNRLVQKALEVPGILDITFDAISDDVPVAPGEKPWLSTLIIQEAE